jgi:hypothetical protein
LAGQYLDAEISDLKAAEDRVGNMDEAPRRNSTLVIVDIEGAVRGCLWQIIEMLTPGETESIDFEDVFDALCDRLVEQGIEHLLEYTEVRLDAVAKLLQGDEWGEWVAPHLSEARRPSTRAHAHRQVVRRASTIFNVCAEMRDLHSAFNE